MGACRSSLENTGKMNLEPILNKNSPWTHMKLELDVLGVARKLVNYVHLSKRKNWKKKTFFSQVAQKENNQFCSEGILGVNP
jgi:hypothetical protein